MRRQAVTLVAAALGEQRGVVGHGDGRLVGRVAGPRSPGVPSSSPVAMALSRTVTSRSSASAGRSAGRSGVTASGAMSPSRGASSGGVSLMVMVYPAGAGSTTGAGRGERTVTHDSTPPTARSSASAVIARPDAVPRCSAFA